MVQKIKTDVDGLLLILIIKQIFAIHFAENEFVLIFCTESSLSKPVFIFSTIFKIKKNIFHIFWVKSCRNLIFIEFADFLSITCP